jgi:hypothetical protein
MMLFDPEVGLSIKGENMAGRQGGERKGLTISDFKLYYRTTIARPSWCWHKTDTATNGIEQKIQKLAHQVLLSDF